MENPVLKALLNGIYKTFELAHEYGTEDDQNLDDYKKMFLDITRVEAENKSNRKALAKAIEAENEESFDEIYNQHKKDVKVSLTQSSMWKDFEAHAKSVLEQHELRGGTASNANASLTSGDNEMQMTSGLLSDIDPITKQQLNRPVRNQLCGHIYGGESIMEAIRTNNRIRCPIMGCANKQPIRPEDLVPDKELARKLYIQRSQQH